MLALALVATAQDKALERVELRVTSTGNDGTVTIDRGSSDGLAAGDRVLFFPLGGGTATGNVLRVDDRSAIVEMLNRSALPAPGTRGEAMIPLERRAREEEDRREAEKEKAVPDHPPWENKDEDFTPDQPLLAKMKAVRPEERPRKLTGLAYLVAQYIAGSDEDLSSMVFRAGVDTTCQNIWDGGDLHVNAEVDYFTNVDDGEDLNLLVRWLSYAKGGNRFAPTRFEVGRFLQTGMPEFGYLDGIEWDRRRTNGHRYGVSAGFMPEPDQDFETFSDFQVSGFYEWVSDPREDLTLSAGFQQTWHHGRLDRDLLVLKFRKLPVNGWDYQGTLWIDFYGGNDNLKSGVDLTQALVTINKRFLDDSGLTFTYQHLALPDILRQGEFTPPTAADIAEDRLDEISIYGWWQMSESWQVNARLVGWIDQQDEGGSGSLGLEVNDLAIRNSRLRLSGYAGIGQYEDVAGASVTYGVYESRGFWELFYEYSLHHEHAFPENLNDIQQHRARLSGGLYLPNRFDVSFYVETRLWDVEFALAVGFNVQRSF